MFVRAVGGNHASLGVGKQIDRIGSLCSVEYFDSPASETIVHNIDWRLLERVTIAHQTRVYILDLDKASWEIGHLLDDSGDSQLVQFPDNKSKRIKCNSVFVRWDLPIRDPTPFLGSVSVCG